MKGRSLTTKVGLVQLGCAKNQVDGEEMLGALAGEGDVRFVADKGDADVLIINTCGFINSAKEESVNAILDAVRRKRMRSWASRALLKSVTSSSEPGPPVRTLSPPSKTATH
jgi:tRNA A37 methylthiotransferase MiaB